MEVKDQKVLIEQGYASLSVSIDGQTYLIPAEQKPTLSRHGIVSVPGSPYFAELPNGERVVQAVADPALFRLWLAFALDERYGREFRGGVINPAEFEEVAAMLEPAARPGARPMIEYLPEALL
jgi:hypothetical protein